MTGNQADKCKNGSHDNADGNQHHQCDETLVLDAEAYGKRHDNRNA
ncbi:MAG: hypothetical protein R3D29_00580 [Nitratireductor sp.]